MRVSKPVLHFFLLLLLLWAKTASASYIVTGAGKEEANGTYVAWETIDGVQAYRKQDENATWYLYRCYGNWVIETDTACFFNEYYNYVNQDTPPETDWRGFYFPYPTVSIAGPAVAASATLLLEDLTNDGRFSTTLTFTHNQFENEGFSGAIGEDFIATNKAVISNLANGLTAQLRLNTENTLVLQLSGVALLSAQANTVNDLTLTFNDSAFISNNASANSNNTFTNLTLQFRNAITVGSAGEFSTLAAAIEAALPYDILTLAAEHYIARNVYIDKNLAIIGVSAAETIIEAMAVPQSENGRVFEIASNLDGVLIKNVTVQNGNVVAGNAYGGAIYSASLLTLENCRFTNNRAVSNGVGRAGAVLAGDLIMRNCTIDNNLASRADSFSQIYGGGIDIGRGYIENSTFTANQNVVSSPSAYAYGGAISVSTALTLVNSTVYGNSSAGLGGGILFEGFTDELVIINSIVYGNSAAFDPNSADVSYYNVSKVRYRNSIVGLKSVADVESQTNLIMLDPLLQPLAFNGGTTATMALGEASPAIGTGEFSSEYPDLDQRGFSRSGQPDIGAYQYAATAPVYITFDSNGNSGVTAPVIGNSYSSGVTLTLPDSDVMALDGFTFLGWNTEPDGTGTHYLPGASYTVPGGNVRLYAQYQSLMTPPQVYAVTVTFTGEGVIDRDGVQQVTENDTLRLFVQASAGFEIARAVTGTCPMGTWQDDYYTTGSITAPCTVLVTFTEITKRKRHLFWKIPANVFINTANVE